MQKNMFFIDFNRWDIVLLSFLPALINVSILVYSLFNFNKNRVNTFFSIFVFLLALWQICYGLMRMSGTIQGATDWYRVSEIMILFVILFGNLFVLRFTGLYKKISNVIVSLFFILPPVVFFICMELKLDSFSIDSSNFFYWIANPIPTPITLIIYTWISVAALFMLLSLWVYYFKSVNGSVKKKQFLYLAIGFTIPVIGGIITEVFFPLVFNWDTVPLTDCLVTSFSVAILITINKYKIFDYSPKHQWYEIIESMNEGLLIVNNYDEIMYANAAFCKLLEYDFEELNGKIAHDLFIDNSENNLQIKNNNELRRLDISNHNEVQFKTKSGKTIWLLISRRPYKDINGKIIGSIGIHTDISQIKEANENLKSVNRELELYVYKASHDLRGPLASMLGLIYVWKTETNDPVANNYLNMLEVTGKKLDYTLTELVKAMNIKEINKFEDVIDFKELIRETLNKFTHYPGFDRLINQIEITIQKEVISNKSLLETILQNLIENVIKYQKFSISEPFNKISVVEKAGKVNIVITDNGIGINESIQSKVFDMYFRGTLDSRGSGLGLYLVKKAVEKLNGEILLISKEGEGTTFTVILS